MTTFTKKGYQYLHASSDFSGVGSGTVLSMLVFVTAPVSIVLKSYRVGTGKHIDRGPMQKLYLFVQRNSMLCFLEEDMFRMKGRKK